MSTNLLIIIALGVFRKSKTTNHPDYDRYAVKPLIKDTPKEDKPPNKGQAKKCFCMHTLYKIVYSPLLCGC